MPIVRKVLLVLLATGVLALSTELEAISIDEFESLNSTPKGAVQSTEFLRLCPNEGFADRNGLSPFGFALAGRLNKDVETLSIGRDGSNCDFDPEHCAVRAPLNISQRTSAATTIRSSDSSNENPGATSLLLLILGLLGISRLRGRPVK